MLASKIIVWGLVYLDHLMATALTCCKMTNKTLSSTLHLAVNNNSRVRLVKPFPQQTRVKVIHSGILYTRAH